MDKEGRSGQSQECRRPPSEAAAAWREAARRQEEEHRYYQQDAPLEEGYSSREGERTSPLALAALRQAGASLGVGVPPLEQQACIQVRNAAWVACPILQTFLRTDTTIHIKKKKKTNDK